MLSARALAAVAIVVSSLSVGSARAATVNLLGIGTPGTLAGNFDPTGLAAMNLDGVGVGTAITIFNGLSNTGGLSLSANTTVTFTFMGKEAGFTNQLLFGNTVLFDNNVAPGTPSATLTVNAGSLPFLFRAPGNLDANDDGSIATGLQIAFVKVSDSVFYALFDDGGAGPDKDFEIWWSGSLPPRSLLHFLARFHFCWRSWCAGSARVERKRKAAAVA